MPESRLKRLWNAVKPPPAVPRQASEHASISVSAWTRFLQTITPPAAAEATISREETQRRRRFLTSVAAIVAVAGGGWGAYAYITSAPSRAADAVQDGMRLMAKGDLAGAESRFTRAVDISPRLASGYLQRGLVRNNLQNLNAAKADFEQALALDPSLAAAHTALGLLDRERGDLAGAMNEFTASIQTAANTDALYQRGQVYASQGQQEKAVADYDAAIRQQPESPFVYRARALSRDALGDHDGAEQDRVLATQIEHH